MKILKLELEIF